MGRIKIEYSSIPHYNFYKDYPYSSLQHVHMIVGVGREIRKITFSPSDIINLVKRVFQNFQLMSELLGKN